MSAKRKLHSLSKENALDHFTFMKQRTVNKLDLRFQLERAANRPPRETIIKGHLQLSGTKCQIEETVWKGPDGRMLRSGATQIIQTVCFSSSLTLNEREFSFRTATTLARPPINTAVPS